MWKFWLVISGVCFAIEAVTVGFLVFWFGIGALLALAISFLTDNIFIQSACFLVSSTLLMFLTRPFVKKFATKKEDVATNAFSLVGKEGIVTQDIDTINGKGQVKVDGEVWSAKTESNDIIEKGSKVEILSIDGVKVLVKPIKTPVKK